MKPEELRVLKAMSEVTQRMDLIEFARLVELSADEALQSIQDLAKTGHLKRSGSGYGITEVGKAVLRAQSPVGEGLEFRFYTAIGQPTNEVAKSLLGLYEAVKTVDVASLEFHLNRGDFENWVQTVLKDEILAGELDSIRQSELKGETLREKLASAIESRYAIEALR